MIIKLYILFDNKLIINKFILSNTSTSIILNNYLNNQPELIKIPIFNIYNGINYETINLPLEFIKIDKNYIFNPYLILSSYNINNENDIDFFYQLNKIINNKYNISFISFNEILKKKNCNLINIFSKYYINNITESFNSNIKLFMINLWININIIKSIFIYINLIKKYNNNIIQYNFNLLNNYKYKLFINSNLFLNLNKYKNYNFNNSLELNNIVINNYYYINNNKTLKYIIISDIINNIIIDTENNKYIYENYSWYNHNPNILIDLNYIVYNTFINIDVTTFIINNLINDYMSANIINTEISTNIIKYYNTNNFLCYLNEIKEINYLEILKSNSYDMNFFINITQLYSYNINNIIEILTILFNNYNYPLKYNKYDLDDIFDYILYYSLYNYKFILKKNYTINNFLNTSITNIIPIKLKSLYINILKILIHVFNNNFDYIIYNQKIYNDYLHKNIIKLFFYDSNKLSINYFKNNLSINIFNKFKNIISTNLLLYDLSYKLSWNTISKKLNYLKIFYINKNIIFYQDKLNKNIISNNIDIKIKKIIENPFEMFNYIKYEKDFIKWTKFISNYLISIYNIPITINHNDIIYIGKIIYLLYNIKEQNLKELNYLNFIIFCNLHIDLILNANKINIKIKQFFPCLKLNINLGVLSKHILLYNNT